MNRVRMRHPDLDAEINVRATAVVHHAASGWVVAEPDDNGGDLPPGVTEVANTTDEPEPVLTKEQLEQSASEDDKPESAPRGRRKTKED